jgi:hypothetical protein
MSMLDVALRVGQGEVGNAEPALHVTLHMQPRMQSEE